MNSDLFYLMKWINYEQINDLVLQVWFFDRLSFTNETVNEYFSYCFWIASEFHTILPHNTKTVTFWWDLFHNLPMTAILES